MWPHRQQPTRLLCPWNSPGQNTGVGSLFLLQEIFLTQGLNPGLPHYRWILYQLSHKGSPRILEWVAYPFSSGSSQPRNQTGFDLLTELSGKASTPPPIPTKTHTWLHFRIRKGRVIYTINLTYNSWEDVKYASGFLWQEDRKRNQEAGRGSEVKKASRKTFSVGGANSLSQISTGTCSLAFSCPGIVTSQRTNSWERRNLNVQSGELPWQSWRDPNLHGGCDTPRGSCQCS